MADYIKSNHHNVILDNTILANYLKEATLASDLPLMADIDSSLYLFSKEVRKHATVVLSGECADEVFGGYPWYTKDYENIEMFPWQGREKGLLRESMRTLLPDEIIDRKKSPYPKTHNPIYTKAVCKMLNDIAQDPNAKLFQIVDKEAVINMINTQGRSFTKPWFGQLMTGPQVIAYLIQLETWLNEYNVKLDI